MEKFFYAMILIISITVGFLFVSDLVIIDYYKDETNSAVINAVTEGFSTLSLENLSARSTSNNREGRSINANSTAAVEKVKKALIRNLYLNESLEPSSESFIINREAVKIIKTEVINESMLPYDYNSETINEESIIVELDLPIKLTFGKSNAFMRIRKVVSLETFLTINEK